jgi:hypothetical protein
MKATLFNVAKGVATNSEPKLRRRAQWLFFDDVGPDWMDIDQAIGRSWAAHDEGKLAAVANEHEAFCLYVLGYFLALLASFGEADGNRLFAASDFLAAPAFQSAALLLVHCAFDVFGSALAVSPHCKLLGQLDEINSGGASPKCGMQPPRLGSVGRRAPLHPRVEPSWRSHSYGPLWPHYGRDLVGHLGELTEVG